jgi:hypothetical protein
MVTTATILFFAVVIGVAVLSAPGSMGGRF